MTNSGKKTSPLSTPATGPTTPASKVLLVIPPVYDTRLPWAQWLQPACLLRLATYLSKVGADIRIIDGSEWGSDTKITRKRMCLFQVDDQEVPQWRFGKPKSAITDEIRALKKVGWQPDDIYIECFATIWWQGAKEIVDLSRKFFPQSRITLFGGYSSAAPDHARQQCLVDDVVTNFSPEITQIRPDLSLLPRKPKFVYLSTNDGKRSASEIFADIEHYWSSHDILQYAFADDSIADAHLSIFRAVLEKVIEFNGRTRSSSQLRFVALGNIAPRDLVRTPELAEMMRQSRFSQIHFADDRQIPMRHGFTDILINEYREAAALCHQAGYRERTGEISASICVGRAGESIPERARVATVIAQVVGSIILWPYQPPPTDYPEVPIEALNGKLFPLRKDNGYGYRDYLDLMGLAVVLNSKHRDKTFNFIGPSFVSDLLKDSLKREAWNPDPAVKGSVRLPLVVRS